MHRLSFATLVLGLALPIRAVDVVVSSNGSYASSSTLCASPFSSGLLSYSSYLSLDGIMFEDISHSGDGGAVLADLT